ncbi:MULTISPECIES: flavin-containing monooxygenase [Microbacterium]|uniref:flavin-containing monooxygenase n=1 Tax=Microbacterium TaxID=33882 RepID=UPI000769D8D1|nr:MULTISPECIES: NAD(P)/FAD-dependent oxidoreductase [Microbacterium]MCT2223804.1 NAD(P)/FAD-dependent oxidoreductase [Microbacterium paraoxydans]
MTAPGLSHRRAIIVGAGQAGLAVAAGLIARGLRPQQDFVVIDAAPRGQRSWASRWHSMELLSPARHSTLPGLPLPGDPRRRPRADEILEYLDSVEAALGVTPVWSIRALGLERRGDGMALTLSTTAGEVQTRNVVCATGASARPRVPEWVTRMRVPGVRIHSSDYHYPKQVPAGNVLVVGGGNSGVQIARELAPSHTVTLSTRTPRRHRPAMRYPAAAGTSTSWTSGAQVPEPVFGNRDEQLRQAGVKLVPAVMDVQDPSTVVLADGEQVRGIDSVILATGYRAGDEWLPEVVRTEPSRRTLTSMPGLFVAGIPAYSRRRADTLAGVGRDAAAIARQIVDRP